MKVNTAEFVLSGFRARDFPADGLPEVAFVGRSNVGKSSLINKMLGRKKLAKTSSTPGRTRAVNFFLINRKFYFVDLPGYGYAKAGKAERREWAKIVDRYLKHALPEGRIVLLVDAKIAGSPLDTEAFQYLESLGASPVIAVTKVDRISRNQRPRCVRQVGERLGVPAQTPIIPVSARTGEGIAALWSQLTP